MTHLLGHYDSRFYKGETVSDEDRTDSLQHMIRAYLSMCRYLAVETWIAHGTLLGWWWNGQILPWDWDLDVQVSNETLSFLAKHLNYTTHVYRSEDIEREYLLDVNPYYTERTRGDGLNVIDARWIDVRNGLFIDITGVSKKYPKGRPSVWSCKNEHEYNTTDIWPLRETSFEGMMASIPFQYERILVAEYGTRALTETEFEG
jgi:phosphorylcholine metabolism protein LicD